MNKDLKKEANKILLHLSKQCFELRVSSIIQNHPEQVEQLKHEETFMMNTYKDSIKVAKQMFPKVVRNTFFDIKLSPRLIDNDFILKALKAFHKEMDFMKDSQKRNNHRSHCVSTSSYETRNCFRKSKTPDSKTQNL